jgi:hypothetical protein
MVPRETPGQRPVDAPQPAPDQTPQQVPGQAPDQAPPQPTPAPGDQTGEPQAERPSVGEMLRQLERMQRAGTGQQQDSERLRQAARELADTLSDEEKKQLAERWLPRPDSGSGPSRVGEGLLEEQPPDGPPPFDRFEDVDLRPDEEFEGRTIAEWLGPQGTEGEPAPPARGRALARKAQTEAERAVEKAVVPSRYHELIQRYFGRLEETVDKAAATKPASGDDTP